MPSRWNATIHPSQEMENSVIVLWILVRSVFDSRLHQSHWVLVDGHGSVRLPNMLVQICADVLVGGVTSFGWLQQASKWKSHSIVLTFSAPQFLSKEDYSVHVYASPSTATLSAADTAATRDVSLP